jgi:hypothetical protein
MKYDVYVVRQRNTLEMFLACVVRLNIHASYKTDIAKEAPLDYT